MQSLVYRWSLYDLYRRSKAISCDLNLICLPLYINQNGLLYLFVALLVHLPLSWINTWADNQAHRFPFVQALQVSMICFDSFSVIQFLIMKSCFLFVLFVRISVLAYTSGTSIENIVSSVVFELTGSVLNPLVTLLLWSMKNLSTSLPPLNTCMA